MTQQQRVVENQWSPSSIPGPGNWCLLIKASALPSILWFTLKILIFKTCNSSNVEGSLSLENQILDWFHNMPAFDKLFYYNFVHFRILDSTKIQAAGLLWIRCAYWKIRHQLDAQAQSFNLDIRVIIRVLIYTINTSKHGIFRGDLASSIRDERVQSRIFTMRLGYPKQTVRLTEKNWLDASMYRPLTIYNFLNRQ